MNREEIEYELKINTNALKRELGNINTEAKLLEAMLYGEEETLPYTHWTDGHVSMMAGKITALLAKREMLVLRLGEYQQDE